MLRWLVIAGALALGGLPARAQEAGDAEDAEPEAETPEGAVVVVVESALRGVGPAVIRNALTERLDGAAVRGLSAREGPVRAWVVVSVHRGGTADLRVVSQNGNESTAHVDSERDLAPAMAIAQRIGELLGAAEADPPIGSVARHGLIPWEDEGLRAYAADTEAAPGFSRVDDQSLLPWPARGEDSARVRPPGRERAAGLSAPTPRGAQNR